MFIKGEHSVFLDNTEYIQQLQKWTDNIMTKRKKKKKDKQRSTQHYTED